MKGVSVAILCCVLAAASANESQGSNRFFNGGFGSGIGSGFGGGFSGGFPGVGGFQGGGFSGGFGGTGGFRWYRRLPRSRNLPRIQPVQVLVQEPGEPSGPVGTKPLACPAVRPTCPFNVRGLRPITCSNDYRCGGVDKCCFDRCLQEHVCKPPSFFG
ncbi:heterogeneous nuclear ribonucleoproteins A1 homolog [Penaeus chinensis]|uniref:heterogeneous nuclear ribonucleoproteins A1 homolog n=1 Tax=Penaeus chinensis TaxID=139456 RepID=UPI001FB75E84|nr:heterogeneous nuclear ribonucleoproteins A1 homolog [Penaeus chinensis]